MPTSLHCIITVLCYFNIAHFKTYCKTYYKTYCVCRDIKLTEAGASVPLTLLSYVADSEDLSVISDLRPQIQKPCHTFFFHKEVN
jgi:hypothetical protein